MPPSQSIDRLVDAMSLEEQVALLSGQDFWSVAPNVRLGIGTLRVTDGPNGARGGGSLIGGVKSAAFPVGISIGASWDPALAEEIGSALADEVKSKGAHVSLAPTVNIHRTVTNGRNFECFSEDPLLTGMLAASYIKGMQAKGVSATIKHFAGNESEIKRTTNSSEIDERSMREIYLVPFEMAVKDAGTWAIMSSYNKINGTYAAENHWLLTKVLREEWGYDGIVMSDWFGSRSTEPTVNAGLNLEMPGPTRDRGAKLIAAVESGKVSRETIRSLAFGMLKLMQRTGSLDDQREHTEVADDRPEHRALIRRAGAEGIVLLKNSGLLPLRSDGGQSFAVVGPNANVAQIMGGGSAQLNPHYSISPWHGLANALGTENRLLFAKGADNNRFQPLLEGDFKVEYFPNKTLSGAPVHVESITNLQAFILDGIGNGKVNPADFSMRVSGSFTPGASGIHRAGVYSTGPARLKIDGKVVADCWTNWTAGQTFFEEGCDEVTGDLHLDFGKEVGVVLEYCSKKSATIAFTGFHAGLGKPSTDDDIRLAAEVAAKADIAIVCVGRSGEWDTEGWDLPDIVLPGLQDKLVEAVAAANPNTIVVLQTGGPVEMPWLEKVSAVLQAWYPGQEAGNAIADVLFGKAEPGGRLPQTFPVRLADNPAFSQDPEIYPGIHGKVRYEEGLFIGHKHYDKLGIPPLFPFGFGLSYTKFGWSDFSVSVQDAEFIAEITVTNAGDRAGSDVVQIYVEDPSPVLPRPLRELKAFAKLQLQPGERATVRLTLPPRAFAVFDVKKQEWISRAGTFKIHAARNAADIAATAAIERKDEWRSRP